MALSYTYYDETDPDVDDEPFDESEDGHPGRILYKLPSFSPEDDVSWRVSAACNQYPMSIFFPRKSDPMNLARLICGTCPVSAECLAFAVSDPKIRGIWAGTSHKQRRAIRTRLKQQQERESQQ